MFGVQSANIRGMCTEFSEYQVGFSPFWQVVFVIIFRDIYFNILQLNLVDNLLFLGSDAPSYLLLCRNL